MGRRTIALVPSGSFKSLRPHRWGEPSILVFRPVEMNPLGVLFPSLGHISKRLLPGVFSFLRAQCVKMTLFSSPSIPEFHRWKTEASGKSRITPKTTQEVRQLPPLVLQHVWRVNVSDATRPELNPGDAISVTSQSCSMSLRTFCFG